MPYSSHMPCREHRRFIVVSGLPGSGKTTVGRRLAQTLGLPMLDKDDILEALFDGLGIGDAEWRNRLSRAADEVLRRLAEQTDGAVLASFWRHPQVTAESGTPTGWLSSLPGKIVEVYCACSPEIAAERFSARKRHDGHLDRDKRSDDLLAGFMELAARGPLGLEPVVNVDTCREIDYVDLLRQLDHRI